MSAKGAVAAMTQSRWMNSTSGGASRIARSRSSVASNKLSQPSPRRRGGWRRGRTRLAERRERRAAEALADAAPRRGFFGLELLELGVGERLRRGEAELVPEHPAWLAWYDAVKAAGQLAMGGSDHQKVGDAASRYEARRRPGQRGSSRGSTREFARRLGQRRSRVSPSGQARSQPLKFRLGSVPGDHLPMIREPWRSRYEC